jgi:hypothetical protein
MKRILRYFIAPASLICLAGCAPKKPSFGETLGGLLCTVLMWSPLLIYFWLKYTDASNARARSLEEEARRLAEEEAAAKRETELLCAEGQKTLELFRDKLLTTHLVIDSNVWMNKEYDPFFSTLSHLLKEFNYQLVLYGPQFDEICNIKRKESYGTERDRSSRLATDRIEQFQKEKLLRIVQLTRTARKRAYADPLIVDVLLSVAEEGKRVCLISDDRELRIRVRQYVPDSALIMGADELLSGCQAFLVAKAHGTLRM